MVDESPRSPTPADQSVDEALALVYDELRAVAARHLRLERPDHTLQPTALVHEAYVKLAQQHSVKWESKAHFICIAAVQIRRILVDHARRRRRVKHGGDLFRVTLTDAASVEEPAFDMLELNEVLDKLDEQSPQDRQIVELKYFGGLTEPEIAQLLEIGERTVRRRWSFARTWLFKELNRA